MFPTFSVTFSMQWMIANIIVGGLLVSNQPNLLAIDDLQPRVAVLSHEEAWALMPKSTDGAQPSLPVWARMLAKNMPRTAAALLQLDYAHRAKSPLPAHLRAAMRWVAANANRCRYTMDQAISDLKTAELNDQRLEGLINGNLSEWELKDRKALKFALDMTVDSDSVSDEQFAELVKEFGEKQTACMVLLMAYANFEDRLLLSLGTPPETHGPMPPVNVHFPAESFVLKTTPPQIPAAMDQSLKKADANTIVDGNDSEWNTQNYEFLQQRMRVQESKPTRLPILPWAEIAPQLPKGLMNGPTDIVWYQVVFGYAPELAVPFELVMRTAGAEASGKWDRIFASGLFWVTTKSVECPYCMGHCEMNWEVAGLSRQQIAERSRLLGDSDWSSFPIAEQHAFAFARKLSKIPWEISDADVAKLQQDLGKDVAFIVMFNASRYHYMTRISNGFQLTLEKENVFYEYYNQKPPNSVASSTTDIKTAVTRLSDEECWKKLPEAVAGSGQPLPSWAKAVAIQLPRTAAAMLKLDYAHRTKSPLDLILRAKMRWVIANANHCDYSKAYAIADLKRSGGSEDVIHILTSDPAKWPEEDHKPLEFARLLTVAAPTIPDELFADLRKTYGDNKVASMVLLAAYGNFQDRIVLGLQLPMEDSGPLAPLEVEFVEDAFQLAPLIPPTSERLSLNIAGEDVVSDDGDWGTVSFDELQARLEKQRDRQPRLPVPTWDDVKGKLPPAMATRPTRIVWSLMTYGYAAELQIPWSIATRTMWAERPGDRVFEESLFWIQTRAIECNYCMGHCEMLLEVAGLDKKTIAERTRKLASDDWSAFPPAEQRAYAYARKLSKAPWTLTSDDYRILENDLGSAQAMSTFWWLCRGLYMTRISDGFQLPLERDNVFGDPAKK